MKKALSDKYHRRQIFFFFAYLSISHFILPQYNKNDFSFFFSWSLFSNGPSDHHYDLSFDEGKTFIIRDYKNKLKKIDTVLFYYLLQSKRDKEFIILYKDYIKSNFNTEKLVMYKLKGTIHQHVFYKSKQDVISQKVLFDD